MHYPKKNTLTTIIDGVSRSVIAWLVLVCVWMVAFPASGMADQETYSFAVFGDSRIPAYAPYDKQHQEALNKLVSIVTRYVGPGSNPGYQAVYNPQTLLLEQIQLPGRNKNELRTITYGPDGWPMVFVDGKGEQARISLVSCGQKWVYDNVVQELNHGAADPAKGPTFCLHTGDMIYFGFQGKGAQESPYWQDFDRRFLSRLPLGGPKSLPARFFPALGNHETWGDRDIVGFRQMFPYLGQYGFGVENRTYYFDHRDSRFIFLDSGIMDPKAPAKWYQSTPGYKEQIELLTKWLTEAVQKKLDHVFVTFHYPVFCRSGFGPLPPEQNPHLLLKSFAGRIDLTVFNGHVHTTELYEVDGVRYFVVGGGGGEQILSPKPMPDDYPQDLYWQGRPRQLDYNYLIVRVRGKDLDITLKRFRPNQLEPFDRVNVVPALMD